MNVKKLFYKYDKDDIESLAKYVADSKQYSIEDLYKFGCYTLGNEKLDYYLHRLIEYTIENNSECNNTEYLGWIIY